MTGGGRPFRAWQNLTVCPHSGTGTHLEVVPDFVVGVDPLFRVRLHQWWDRLYE